MSLFRGAIRPPAIPSDEAIERYLAAIRAEIRLDPLFRRRLRGQVMNRYVAAREGIGTATPRRSMGRLGRAVLYASFTLAATSTSVLAASQEALPGDLLYPLKRQVEALRVQVLPSHLHDDLAAYAVAERITELGHLAERGEWDRVAVQAAAVGHDYEAFLALADAAAPGSNERYLTVFAGLVDRLPGPARAAVEAVIALRSGTDATGSAPSGPAGSAPGGSAGGEVQGDATPEPKPTKTPKPDPSPRPSRDAETADDDPDDDRDEQ